MLITFFLITIPKNKAKRSYGYIKKHTYESFYGIYKVKYEKQHLPTLSLNKEKIVYLIRVCRMRKSDKVLLVFTDFLRHEEGLIRNWEMQSSWFLYCLCFTDKKIRYKKNGKRKRKCGPDIEEMEALVTRAGKYARETPACSTPNQAKSRSSVRNISQV